MQELAGVNPTKPEVFLIPAHRVQYALLAEGQTDSDKGSTDM